MSDVRPWVRYFARYIDMLVFGLILGIVLPIPDIYIAKYIFLFTIILYFLWVFVEPILLSTWGTTFGKALLKVRLRTKENTKLTYIQALKRSGYVWFRGLGLELPLISIITMIAGYVDLRILKMTPWDRDGGFVVTHGKIGFLRTISAILVIVSILILGFIGLAKIDQKLMSTQPTIPNYVEPGSFIPQIISVKPEYAIPQS